MVVARNQCRGGVDNASDTHTQNVWLVVFYEQLVHLFTVDICSAVVS